MEQIQTVFVDCDGVLYDNTVLTYDDIVQACCRAGEELGIHWDEVEQVHTELKQRGYRGWYNTTLELCRRYGTDFNQIAQYMVRYIDYHKLTVDLELLDLLHSVSQVKQLAILTNNTRPHLQAVFSQLFHQSIESTGLKVLTVEDTLWDDYFHVKAQGDSLTHWCRQFHTLPKHTLLLDDTPSVCLAAEEQGLQVVQIKNAQMTKEILKGLQ